MQLEDRLGGGEGGLQPEALFEQRRSQEGNNVQVQTITDEQHPHLPFAVAGNYPRHLIQKCLHAGELVRRQQWGEILCERGAIGGQKALAARERLFLAIARVVALLQLFTDVQRAISSVVALEEQFQIVDKDQQVGLDKGVAGL